jgi:Holliday junction resolvase-like predicted endonuclease
MKNKISLLEPSIQYILCTFFVGVRVRRKEDSNSRKKIKRKKLDNAWRKVKLVVQSGETTQKY